MGSRSRAIGLAIAACLFVSAPAFAQSAADKETARSLMDQGNDLRDKGDLKNALQRFQAANEIMHVPTTAMEVARTQVALGMLVEARDSLAQIISSVPAPREPAQFKEARVLAQKLDAELEARVPTVTVTVNGAKEGSTTSLSVDGVAVPAAVIGLPRRLNPGHHVMVATTSTQEGRAELDVAEGEKKDVSITLATIAKPTTTVEEPVEKPAPPPEESHKSYALPIVLFAIGGASLIAGGITGVMELGQQSTLSTNCPNKTCPPSQYGTLDSANTLATISTVTLIVGGVGVAAGIVTLFIGGGKSTPPSTQAHAHVEPWIGLGSAGLRGTF